MEEGRRRCTKGFHARAAREHSTELSALLGSEPKWLNHNSALEAHLPGNGLLPAAHGLCLGVPRDSPGLPQRPQLLNQPGRVTAMPHEPPVEPHACWCAPWCTRSMPGCAVGPSASAKAPGVHRCLNVSLKGLLYDFFQGVHRPPSTSGAAIAIMVVVGRARGQPCANGEVQREGRLCDAEFHRTEPAALRLVATTVQVTHRQDRRWQ